MSINIQTQTKKELEAKKNELETEFNRVRDELSHFIESTESVIKEKTSLMDKLSTEWTEINAEINKRDGKPVK